MKIAVVSAAVSNRSGSRAPVELAVHLAKRGHEVIFSAFDRPFEKEADDYLKANNVVVDILGSAGLLGRWLAAARLWRRLFSCQPLPRRQAGPGLAFDVISTHCTFPFSVAAGLSGIPVVKTYYGLQLFSWNALDFKEKLVSKFFDLIILWREKIVFKMADEIAAISKYLAKEAEDLCEKKTDYVYIGVSKNAKCKVQNAKLQIKDKITLKQGDTLILSVSRIVPYKGFDVLIQALKKIKLPWHLVVVGSYGNEKYFKKIKSLADQRVTFLRNVSDPDLSVLYDLCDLYASGNRTWEGFGMPFLEAGLYGKPSVAFNHTALPEVIVHGKTGFLANSDEEFVVYLEQLLQDKKLCQMMGEAARKYAEKFTWENCAEKYEKLFEGVKRK